MEGGVECSQGVSVAGPLQDCVTPHTLQEGKDIQHGLLALGKVLEALKNGSGHVPYRDSTMTGMMRDVLSGDCKTMILCCVNPG